MLVHLPAVHVTSKLRASLSNARFADDGAQRQIPLPKHHSISAIRHMIGPLNVRVVCTEAHHGVPLYFSMRFASTLVVLPKLVARLQVQDQSEKDAP